MSASKEDVLSPEELRKKLYQTFKNRGVLDTLKTQLRNQLIHELKHPLVSGGETVPRPVPVKSASLLVLACNSIVADHLQTSGYEYTLSVFYPESGMCKEKNLTTADLLQLMKISPQSTLYKSLSLDKHNKKGFLVSLLEQLTDQYPHELRCDADTQTKATAGYGESLVYKMKMIDEEYESLHYKGDKWMSYETKLAAYRKEIESQLQAEMSTKLQHFKDVEIAKVKMEEKAISHKEFENLRQDMEKTYELKTKALMEREKNAIERLQKQQEIEENNLYMQRQSILKEIETVRNRENEMRLRMEAFEKTCQIHEDKIKSTEELLRRRELAVKTIEDTYDQNMKNELSRYQLQLKEDFIKRTEKLTENEYKNKVETARIQKEAAAIDAKVDEHNKVCSERQRLQIELDTSQQQVSLLSQQKDMLRERLETMSDYSILKREKVELQAQVQLLKKQLEEDQEENRQLRIDMGKPSEQQLALQMELRRLQAARRLEQEEFDNQRQVLQAQLHCEVERCAQLAAQLAECEQKAQWRATHVEEVKMQLRQTQQALENEVLRNPKPSLVDRSVLELSADKLVPPDFYVERALLRPRAACDHVCEAGDPSRGQRSPWGRSRSPDSDIDLLAGAKARIRELEKEAETLDEAYRNYQQRAVRIPISHMLSSRAGSPRRACAAHCPDSPQREAAARLPQSPKRPKVSLGALCPAQHITHLGRTPSPDPYQTRTSIPAPQQRVTFSQDLTHPGPSGHLGLQEFDEPLIIGEGVPDSGTSSPSRRLSSTPLAPSRQKLQTQLSEEGVVSPVPFPELSSERQLSPARCNDLASSGDFHSELSPPPSPQMKSTARHQCSPPNVQQVLSSSESSPQPEKITLNDLTETLPEPSHIPELLLDTAIPVSEEAPTGPSVPPPQPPWDLPDTQIHMQAQGKVLHALTDDEEEELRWQRERIERQERRQRELEEAKEREMRALERLEREMNLHEEEQTKQGVEEKEEVEKEEPEEGEKEDEGCEKASPVENPLEKYMKMVLDAREKLQAQSAGGEQPYHTSLEAKSLSEEKDDSIAAYSHDVLDDDFW